MDMAAASDGQRGVSEVDEDRALRAMRRAWGEAAGNQWQAASYRCSCGVAHDDQDEFGRHLDAAEGADPEHFEVLDGWSLPQVRQWQATAEARMTSHVAEAS
jgi:hypothetical protein